MHNYAALYQANIVNSAARLREAFEQTPLHSEPQIHLGSKVYCGKGLLHWIEIFMDVQQAQETDPPGTWLDGVRDNKKDSS